jgi:hypothetical protein
MTAFGKVILSTKFLEVFFTPKGFSIVAQGNALGNEAVQPLLPFLRSPPKAAGGDNVKALIFPGCLPWANICSPFRAKNS